MKNGLQATPTNVYDASQTASLLTDEEEAVYGDSGYLGVEKREDAIVWKKSERKINCCTFQLTKLSKRSQSVAKKAEHVKSAIHAKVEHGLAVFKKQLRF